MKKIVLALVILLTCSFFSFRDVMAREVEERTLEGEIISIQSEEIVKQNGEQYLQQFLQVKITRPQEEQKIISLKASSLPFAGERKYQVGDKVVLTLTQLADGSQNYFIADFVRRMPLLYLFLILLVLVILVARLKGLASFLSLGLSFLVVFYLLLPQLYQGKDPLGAILLSLLFLIPLLFFLSHGINRKTIAAILATFIALAVTLFLTKIFLNLGHFSGFASEEAGFLRATGAKIKDFRGLLLAGIIIGTLGVLDDVTVSQAAIVQQLKETNPKLKARELFLKAMKVGQDHIASMINTLILVYTGASLPLLLLFVDSNLTLSQAINFEMVAEEIARMLLGSIGLVLAVPLTTVLAVLLFKKK